jgi:hypothetical protein
MAKKKQEETTLPYDYSEFKEESAPNQEDVLGRISKLADEMHKIDKEIAEAELKVKKLKASHQQIAEEQLPELFEQVGMEELKTRSGLPLKLKNKVFTNISKGRKPKAIAWLDENGQGGMVKRCVIIDFDKTQEDKVAALLRLIGKGWPNNRTELDVHASTVKAFVTRQLADGKTIPADIFGIHCVDVVEITSK